MQTLGRVTAAGVTAALLVPVAAGAASPARGESPAASPISRAEARQRPVLREGDRGRWVRRLHRALRIAPARQPFGPATGRSVMAFRATHGLRAKPIVSVRTWMLLGSLVVVGRSHRPAPGTPVTTRPVLRPGDTSGWVQAVQVALGVEPASGYFGTLTSAAVRAFQARAAIPVTGIVDARTWAALGSRVREPRTDVTTTDRARSSRSHRAAIGVARFAASWTARMVVRRESGGRCDVSSPGGTYRGKWQMDAAFWSHYGGMEFAARPDLATCAQQDMVAYRGWVDRWWQPWPTAIP